MNCQNQLLAVGMKRKHNLLLIHVWSRRLLWILEISRRQRSTLEVAISLYGRAKVLFCFVINRMQLCPPKFKQFSFSNLIEAHPSSLKFHSFSQYMPFQPLGYYIFCKVQNVCLFFQPVHISPTTELLYSVGSVKCLFTNFHKRLLISFMCAVDAD